ncbi:hypothetical protein MSAN_00240900 [Mycena sanguinolenta]|uniref:Uncharacterized protein n=1 Tax=Mycena sanguinolenta TaxID=230812 RepID=A0A8H6ZIJ0_9AGAR|nr:hypothetical protein MSAN_00240900 [Mycena sanguinolenta]
MPPAVNDANIPDGFVCVNDHPTELWSKAAFDHVERLQTDEENRNPDAHDVYIYNDYFGYACCDLLKKEMLAIGKMVASKKDKLSINTFHRLEALTLYMANSAAGDMFPTIDDAELAEAIYNAYGALWMTYILDLEAAAKPEKLSPTHPVPIPNLENAVRTSAEVITQYTDLGFDNDAEELQSAMLRVLARNGMDGTPKKKLFLGKSSDSDNEEEEGDDDEDESSPSKKQPSSADDADVRAVAKAWKASAAMKALREAYGPVEHSGRPWDITKWPKAALAAEKARFGALDGEDEDDLFF